MRIETLPDWNTVLDGCGCCPMPRCPVPTKECESMVAAVGSAGFFDTADTSWIIYRRHKFILAFSETFNDGFTDYSASANETSVEEYTATFSGSINSGEGGCTVFDATLEETCTTEGTATRTYKFDGSTLTFIETKNRTQTSGTVPGDPCEWTDTIVFTDHDVDPPDVTTSYDYNVGITTIYPYVGGNTTETDVYELPQTYAEWLADTLAAVDAAMTDFDGCASGTACVASTVVTAEPETTGGTLFLTAIKARFRWVIPDTWTGSYFKITWDLVFFPEDESTPTVVALDQTWTWTGPGDPEDADTWKSGWYEIDPPEEPGETRIVNVRYECYRSTRLGIKPQITGEAYEIPT